MAWKKRNLIGVLIGIVGIVLVQGCGQISGPSAAKGTANSPTGTASVKITAAEDSPFSRIADSAVATVSADDMNTVVTMLMITDTSVEGLITGIPAGDDRRVTIDVYDTNRVLQYSGSCTVDVVADSVVRAVIDIIRILGGVDVSGAIIESKVSDPLLIAYWSFDSSSGDTYYDVTGNGFNASSGGLTLTDGVKGKALDCPGEDFELIVENSADHFNLLKFTIETWFFSDIDIGTEKIMIKLFDYQKIKTGIYNGYGLTINESGHVMYSMANQDYAWKVATSETILDSKKWYHIVGTYDGEELKLYINGELEAATPFSGTYALPEADARIGCQTLADDNTVRNRVNGRLDEMKLYKYALSSETIKEHYEELKPDD